MTLFIIIYLLFLGRCIISYLLNSRDSGAIKGFIVTWLIMSAIIFIMVLYKYNPDKTKKQNSKYEQIEGSIYRKIN